ncbi:MAG: ABC transporter ATP-binding protein [Actinomyces sp.]|jgi:putative ABC transport system ATP-binding protein|nr:ABC transporter ATP-binding protein [Actinomyces sp.]MCI1642858.1 ABC transporter ATP-binding protein [Actinomyces sp.]MCI1662898.1 ABC transporter ATP-binding protein [Actinomyces sp.]MCI1692119.1 ABC transporter ATP-binding protein [Actinomyces sp.]MCI1787846.1 ABC transporter ATP-binding protein [Actinomyces sp.]MCI1829818.1 ABC transporter ATP-binding protein [Actinomyces sp.]
MADQTARAAVREGTDPVQGATGEAAEGESIYSVRNVSRRYGELAALDDVSLEIRRGDWVSIVGPSGSGKSTLMNILGCMDSPTEGIVLLEGERLDKMGEPELATVRRQKIGLVFQQFHLVQHLTAVENVMLAQYYHSIPDEKEAMAALDRVGMADRATHLPRELSGGEQQRVCVARALINHPDVILADEPTGNLDEVNERIVIDFFHTLHDAGTTLIVVTHDAEVAAQGGRQIILEHGRIAREAADVASTPTKGRGAGEGGTR